MAGPGRHSTSNAIKNSVLFLLLILIAHVIAKHHTPTPTPPTPAPGSAPAPKPKAEVDDIDGDDYPKKKTDADLLEYVFGPPTLPALPQVPPTAPVQAQQGPAVHNGDAKGNMMIGNYPNENTMCGGEVLGGGLQCFDHSASAYQTLV